jgi:ABC-2 type transport system permease protein
MTRRAAPEIRPSALRAALVTESLKFRRARVVLVTSVMLVVGIAVLSGSMLLAAAREDPRTAAKLGTLVEPGGWVGYLAAAGQITAVAGLLGFGVALAWSFGREFTDGTVSGLFGLPVPRPTIAAAKLLVHLGWVLVVSVALAATLLVMGFAFGLGGFDPAAAPLLGRQVAVAGLTGLLAVPAGWAATLGRGPLGGIAVLVGIIVVAQVAAIGGVGAWFPFAAVGVWAASPEATFFTDVGPAHLALTVPVAALFAALTLRAWQRLQLDR